MGGKFVKVGMGNFERSALSPTVLAAMATAVLMGIDEIVVKVVNVRTVNFEHFP